MARKVNVITYEFIGHVYFMLGDTLFHDIRIRNKEERKFLRKLWHDSAADDSRTAKFVRGESCASSLFMLKVRFEEKGETVCTVLVDRESTCEVLCSLWEYGSKDHVATYRIPRYYYVGSPLEEPPREQTWGEALTSGQLTAKLKNMDAVPKEKGWVPF